MWCSGETAFASVGPEVTSQWLDGLGHADLAQLRPLLVPPYVAGWFSGLSDSIYAGHIAGAQQLVSHLLFLRLPPFLLECGLPHLIRDNHFQAKVKKKVYL